MSVDRESMKTPINLQKLKFNDTYTVQHDIVHESQDKTPCIESKRRLNYDECMVMWPKTPQNSAPLSQGSDSVRSKRARTHLPLAPPIGLRDEEDIRSYRELEKDEEGACNNEKCAISSTNEKKSTVSALQDLCSGCLINGDNAVSSDEDDDVIVPSQPNMYTLMTSVLPCEFTEAINRRLAHSTHGRYAVSWGAKRTLLVNGAVHPIDVVQRIANDLFDDEKRERDDMGGIYYYQMEKKAYFRKVNAICVYFESLDSIEQFLGE